MSLSDDIRALRDKKVLSQLVQPVAVEHAVLTRVLDALEKRTEALQQLHSVLQGMGQTYGAHVKQLDGSIKYGRVESWEGRLTKIACAALEEKS